MTNGQRITRERKCPQCGFPMWLDADEWVCDEIDCEHTEPADDDEDTEDSDEDIQD